MEQRPHACVRSTVGYYLLVTALYRELSTSESKSELKIIIIVVAI